MGLIVAGPRAGGLSGTRELEAGINGALLTSYGYSACCRDVRCHADGLTEQCEVHFEVEMSEPNGERYLEFSRGMEKPLRSNVGEYLSGDKGAGWASKVVFIDFFC